MHFASFVVPAAFTWVSEHSPPVIRLRPVEISVDGSVNMRGTYSSRGNSANPATAPLRNMANDLPAPLDVIAVGAHPDDVEIACGGTLAQLVRQGYRVGIVDLTDGEPTPGSPGPEVRLMEAAEAARILGVHVRQTLELPNRRLFDSHEARLALATVFRRFRPSIVLGLAAKTPLASPDHYQAVQITDAAVFYSRLSKWDDQFDGLPVHTIKKQVWFPLGFFSLQVPAAAGNISSWISAKPWR